MGRHVNDAIGALENSSVPASGFLLDNPSSWGQRDRGRAQVSVQGLLDGAPTSRAHVVVRSVENLCRSARGDAKVRSRIGVISSHESNLSKVPISICIGLRFTVRNFAPISVSTEARDERASYPGEKPSDALACPLFLLRMARRY